MLLRLAPQGQCSVRPERWREQPVHRSGLPGGVKVFSVASWSCLKVLVDQCRLPYIALSRVQTKFRCTVGHRLAFTLNSALSPTKQRLLVPSGLAFCEHFGPVCIACVHISCSIGRSHGQSAASQHFVAYLLPTLLTPSFLYSTFPHCRACPPHSHSHFQLPAAKPRQQDGCHNCPCSAAAQAKEEHHLRVVALDGGRLPLRFSRQFGLEHLAFLAGRGPRPCEEHPRQTPEHVR